MEQVIESFPEQLSFGPKIENGALSDTYDMYVVIGMGGSHLAADLLAAVDTHAHIIVHSDYGLPRLQEKTLKGSLIILSSYSGDTEEVIDAFGEAQRRNLSMLVVSIGGRLLMLAREHNVPYIQLPDTGIEPRYALGFSFRALLKALNEKELLKEVERVSGLLKPEIHRARGEELAEKLAHKIPLVYASRRNWPVAYNWKIKFNETTKIPSFYNTFPELNHNEMEGFDVQQKTKKLPRDFHCIFLTDKEDHPQIQKRMNILASIFEKKSVPVECIHLQGESRLEKIFNSLILADWVSYSLAKTYDVKSIASPMIAEFKKEIA